MTTAEGVTRRGVAGKRLQGRQRLTVGAIQRLAVRPRRGHGPPPGARLHLLTPTGSHLLPPARCGPGNHSETENPPCPSRTPPPRPTTPRRRPRTPPRNGPRTPRRRAKATRATRRPARATRTPSKADLAKERRQRQALEKRLKDFEDRDLTDLQKAQKQATEATKQLEELQRESLRQRVALKAGTEHIHRLQGSTEHELAADAAELAKLLTPKGATTRPLAGVEGRVKARST
jgi:hypothetical protein